MWIQGAEHTHTYFLTHVREGSGFGLSPDRFSGQRADYIFRNLQPYSSIGLFMTMCCCVFYHMAFLTGEGKGFSHPLRSHVYYSKLRRRVIFPRSPPTSNSTYPSSSPPPAFICLLLPHLWTAQKDELAKKGQVRRDFDVEVVKERDGDA